MSNYIDWYAVELRTRLATHMPSARVESIVREAECHLKESAEMLKSELGISQEAAALAAIDAFGKPEKVALTHLGEMDVRVLGLKPRWLVLISAFVALFCWNFHWLSLGGPLDNFGETWQNGLAGFAGFLALVGLVVGCAAGKRSYRLPLLALGVQFILAGILFASFWVVSDNGYDAIMRPSVGRARNDLPRYIARLDRVRDFVVNGQKEFLATNTGEVLPAIYTDFGAASREIGDPTTHVPWIEPGKTQYVVPYSYIQSMPDGRMWALSSEESFSKARQQWRNVDRETLPQIEGQKARLGKMLDRVNEAANGRLFFFHGFVAAGLSGLTIIFLPALLLLDWVVFTIVRTRRAWPVRSLA